LELKPAFPGLSIAKRNVDPPTSSSVNLLGKREDPDTHNYHLIAAILPSPLDYVPS
jgi:hypothetical protein